MMMLGRDMNESCGMVSRWQVLRPTLNVHFTSVHHRAIPIGFSRAVWRTG